MNDCKQLACFYVAFLRCIYLLNQNFHWVTNGPNFYSQHLLFERIYKSAEENADLAAEKIIGLWGSEVIDINEQGKCIAKILAEAVVSKNLAESALKLEEKFQQLSEQFYSELEEQNKLTLGLDDAIMSIASDREESIYLLKQVLKG